MFWIVLPVAVAAAAVVSTLLAGTSAAERRSRTAWKDKRDEVSRTVEECRRKVEVQLGRATESLDFHFLIDLHYSSFRVANMAYALLEDASISIRTMQRLIDDAGTKREAQKAKLDIAESYEERQMLLEEVFLLKEFRGLAIEDIKKVRAQREKLKSEVGLFNSRTAELKIAIRDRCGEGGKIWYDRLEKRKVSKRS